MPVVLSGSLDEVYRKLLAAKAVTSYRKVDGWKLFQSDETWTYETQHDAKVCPVCQSFESYFGSGLSGIVIPLVLPEWHRTHPIVDLPNNAIYPNVHEMPEYSWLRGICRCIAYFNDYLFVLAERLMREIGDLAG